MLAYAANTRPLGRTESPRALALIIAGHAILLGALFMARTEIVRVIQDPTDIIFVKTPKPPPPPPTIDEPRTPTHPIQTTLDRPDVIIPLPPQPGPFETTKIPDFTPFAGDGADDPVTPYVPPKADPVRTGPRFATRDDQLRPPYPLSKIRTEEEATLRLKLTIDSFGRVTAVDPVGSADPEFLAAARRHILRAWRYKPATEDGTAVSSTVVITLSFKLNDA